MTSANTKKCPPPDTLNDVCELCSTRSGVPTVEQWQAAKETGRSVEALAFAFAEREAKLQGELARLHKLFDDAGDGEYNVLALVDHYQKEALGADTLRARVAELEAEAFRLRDERHSWMDAAVGYRRDIRSAEAREAQHLARIAELEALLRLQTLQRRAKRKRIPCTLTVEQVKALIAAPACSMCGASFTAELPMTFERKNPLLGYTKRNTVAACMPCNSHKGGVVDKRVHDLQRRDSDIRAVVAERESVRAKAGAR